MITVLKETIAWQIDSLVKNTGIVYSLQKKTNVAWSLLNKKTNLLIKMLYYFLENDNYLNLNVKEKIFQKWCRDQVIFLATELKNKVPEFFVAIEFMLDMKVLEKKENSEFAD